MTPEPLKIGDEARWDGVGPHFTTEPQTVRIATVDDSPARSYGFSFTADHPHPNGPVPVRAFIRHVSPEHLTREG